jgi:hypothetical protein
MTDPIIEGCTTYCDIPWGHSKGMLAWDANGDGLVLQVTTPSWPASGNKLFPRVTDGNTLGCVKDNNVLVNQHFFALRLTRQDVVKVLIALQNASVVTNPANSQFVSSRNLRTFRFRPGRWSPPFQAVMPCAPQPGGLAPQSIPRPHPCRLAAGTNRGKPGAVQIATTGKWDEKTLGLEGGLGSDYNHAKIGVSISGTDSIFGGMNQQGTLSGPQCGISQNARGGLFYILENQALHESIARLISGASAPVQAQFPVR